MNEYGIEPAERLSIGSKISKELLGKLIADMRNMREESLATSWGEDEGEGIQGDEPTEAPVGSFGGGSSSIPREGAFGSEPQGDGDHEAGVESLHRLCPTHATEYDVISPLRHVRTRIYFTSESHIHSLVNCLRYCHQREGCTEGPILSPESLELLNNTTEYDYLTHIVFRMYENKIHPVSSADRFRVEISFSPGSGE